MESKQSTHGRVRWGETSERGFSLVELMVVISIIGLLAGIVAVNVLKAGGKAKVTKVRADVSAFDDAIVMYHLDVGQFPQALEDLVQGGGEGWDGPYIKGGAKALNDPWNKPYYYAYTGGGDPPYELGSYGADGVPGGEGENVDVFPSQEQ
jgi:general secretion pathway protein G